jgi:2-deoxy-scyllo-inosamine dehydrogenase (SAM-dependent)
MTDLFRAILIETRNVCTRKCWFCKFGQERQDDGIVQMEWGTIRTILENLKALHYNGRISWYNINEPLLDRRIVEIVRMTREYCPQAFVSLATNGDLLDDSLYHDLKASGLDALGVSVYDDKTYEKVKKLADRQMVLIDMRLAGEEVLENRGGGICQDIPAFERDRALYRNRSCVRPFVMMVVNPHGQVVLCCDDMYGDVIIGDVHSQRLEQIWNNERFAFYRTTLNHEGRGSLALCSDCSYSGEGFRPFFPYFDEKPVLKLRDRILIKLEPIRRIFNSNR